MANKENSALQLTSPAFQHEADIPAKYTCDGENINPPLDIKNIPQGTISLALVMDDPDAPGGTYDHWVMWHIRPAAHIGENSVPGISGTNSDGKTGYFGPCPPSGSHRYYFYIYALDTEPSVPAGSSKETLLAAIRPSVIEEAVLMGRYKRSNN